MSHPHAQHGQAGLAMTPLPVLDGSDVRPPLAMQDWVQTLPATLDEARNAAIALRDLVQDAVYLDEDCYSSAVEHTHYQDNLHGQQKQIHDLENEAAALRAELERKDELLAAAAARQREAKSQITELQHELENNAVVFRMHYQELLTRNDEIERLKAVIEGLQGGP
ncbi:hypothetical protein PLESTB_000499500 [Pleodorina starrii]|uniref:Uncharacterized protein n=1 Tax=Pleodorina starrii TaxID=330485 RepID=A0A9W6BGL7_9CHLO|nr:hypothetical protein PLESTM_000370900 [Pleodorina starrii]GLC51413.1 hypothetical protein PLESTB_000499500 [Pleodorina starrii]GLC63778.1 hypothetical protein PLESTF_000073000 [Pleodorina starrii]